MDAIASEHFRTAERLRHEAELSERVAERAMQIGDKFGQHAFQRHANRLRQQAVDEYALAGVHGVHAEEDGMTVLDVPTHLLID